MRQSYLVKSLLLAALVCPTAIRADIVVNGGFETNSGGSTFPSTASPWTITNPNPGADDGTGVCTTSNCGPPFGPHSGNAYFYGGAWTGSNSNSTPGTVSQALTTTPDTRYEISFWLAQPAAGTTNSWRVSWDNVPLTPFINGVTRDAPVFPYTEFFLVAPAILVSGSDTVTFSFYDNAPAGELSGYELDDVSISALAPGTTGFSSFPEPGAGVLLMTMLFAVAGLVVLFKKRLA
jgi:hypothetical protein